MVLFYLNDTDYIILFTIGYFIKSDYCIKGFFLFLGHGNASKGSYYNVGGARFACVLMQQTA